MFGGGVIAVKVYIAFNKSKNGVRASYAYIKEDIQHFYYRRFDRNTDEQEVFDYIMSYVNDFSTKSDETFLIFSNSKKINRIIRNTHNTKKISFVGKVDSDEARNVFVKLQTIIIKKVKNNE